MPMLIRDLELIIFDYLIEKHMINQWCEELPFDIILRNISMLDCYNWEYYISPMMSTSLSESFMIQHADKLYWNTTNFVNRTLSLSFIRAVADHIN